MPTTDTPQHPNNIPLALQSLFYKLQYNDASVSTKHLTRSFGWDANESFMQVSVHQLMVLAKHRTRDALLWR